MSSDIKLGVLPDADGSAHFSSRDVSVLVSVNGPLEVQRRDELPDEATIDVSVRPSAGVAGVRERFFEGLIHKTLKQIIRVNQHPRTLIQVTLQITASSDTEAITGRSNQAASLLHLLPPLLNAAMLALLCSSIPLSTTFSSTIVAAMADGQIIPSPVLKQREGAKSIHVLAYSAQGKLILVESEGSFDIDVWEACIDAGKESCLNNQSDDTEMIDESKTAILSDFRHSIEARISQSEQWRQKMKG